MSQLRGNDITDVEKKIQPGVEFTVVLNFTEGRKEKGVFRSRPVKGRGRDYMVQAEIDGEEKNLSLIDMGILPNNSKGIFSDARMTLIH